MTRFLLLGLIAAFCLSLVPEYDHELYSPEEPAVVQLHASLQ